MSLPDAPNTLREKYYSVMAGQNDADILPDIDTAPSTENRYLDYIARNGGGGGGDVTKEYVDEQDAKKTDKVTSAISGNFAGLDENGNLTDSGKNAADFATASDMTAVQGVIPSTATTQNKLATAADTAGEEIASTATGTSITLTDSTDGMVQGVTVKGHSEVVDGAIKSIGDAGWGVVDLGTVDWLYTSGTSTPFFYAEISNYSYPTTVEATEQIAPLICSKYPTTSQINRKDKTIYGNNSATNKISISDTSYTDATAFKSAMSGVLLYYPLADTTGATPTFGITSKDGAGQGTAATITTGLPLRSVSDSITDELTSTKVITKCPELDLGTLTWEYASNRFQAQLSGSSVISGGVDAICDNYTLYKGSLAGFSETDKSINVGNLQLTNIPYVLVRDTSYTDAATFATAMSGVKLVYPLATPIETPLTSAEKSALASLRTYDHTTYIDATDAPTMTVDYLLNTDNGQAVANLDNKIKSGFDELKKESEHFVYAFYIDHNDTNPATCVHPYISKYGCDNYFYIPAKMNYTTGTFDYGSWRDFVYRIAKPCMVAYNGHVDYYLDPDDYSSKIDGYGVSDIDDMSYAGNVMVELDCLYFKRWKANNKSYVVISDQKLDKSFKAYAHHDKNGKVLEHIYLGAYNGSYDGTRLRSISDIECHNLNALTTNKIMSNTTRQQEMDFAMANNVQGEAGEGWFIRHKADWDYINTLLILIGMNTNTQATFGNGNISSYVSTSNTGILTTGTMNDKGLFYGKNDNVSGVKVFGIENWWGNMWVSIAGWNLVNGVQKIKMSYDQSDVSSVDGFNVTDGTGFATVSNSTPSGTNGGYISDWTIGDFGLIPTVASGASDKRLCDGLWFNNSANCFAWCGGGSGNGVRCGAFFAGLDGSVSHANWSIGAALSYKPLSA